MKRAVRIGNCSGFYGDRLAAAREMVDGGPLDVLTGDWLAELTMTILARTAMKGGPAYARTFVTQLRDVLADCRAKGIVVVSNAGGLDPQGCADAIAEFAPAGTKIAVVTGDNLTEAVPSLREQGEEFRNLDTDETFDSQTWPALTANAYLGAGSIQSALAAGAHVVITGRVTDAAVVVGPAAWWHDWDLADAANADAIAGAVAAGHIIECGAQATGGNYPFFEDIPNPVHPGFPIAEIAADGSCVITKHEGTPGMVTPGTVTAQLLYEVNSPRYLTPDVTARFDTLNLAAIGPDRVQITGTRGESAPERLKVAMTRLAGFRNSMELVLTGLNIEAKAEYILAASAGVTLAQCADLDPAQLAAASNWDVTELTIELLRRDQVGAPTLATSQASLRITAKDPDPKKVAKPITAALIENGLASYPGFYATTPPGSGTPYAVLWPTTVSRAQVSQRVAVSVAGVQVDYEEAATPLMVATESTVSNDVVEPVLPLMASSATTRLPLGTFVGARSGDKAGLANIGLWVRHPAETGGAVVSDEQVALADLRHRWLRQLFTPDFAGELLADVAPQGVQVYHFDNLRALNLVLPGALGRGVADSTSIDPQAKSLGEYLRAKLVDIPTQLLEAG